MENKENKPAGKINITDYTPDEHPHFKEFEPKTNNKFLVYMDKIPTHLIHKVIRPISSVIDGEYTYSDLVLIAWDPIIPSTSEILQEFQRDNKIIFDEIVLDILGPVGDVVEKWVYKKCELKDIQYSVLDWADSQPINITMRLKFEDCVHEF